MYKNIFVYTVECVGCMIITIPAKVAFSAYCG